MSAAFIGCKISLISKSEIRYEGILYTIDTKESTIALAKVRSFGTEDRQTDKPVAPRNEVYEYIIFRASDIKDLIVDDPPASTPALSDPAIIQAQSTGTSTLPSATSYASTSSGSGSASAPGATTKSTLSSVLAGVAASAQQQQQQGGSSRGSTPTNRGKSSPVNVEGIRKSGYMNQNRSSNQQQQHHQNQNQQRSSGGYGGGRQQQQHQQHHQQPQYQMQQNRGPPRQQQGTGRVTGGGGAGGASYGNQSNPRGGGRPQGQGGQRPPFQNRSMNFYRRPNNFQRTPRADPAKLEEYDFEKANLEFTELEKGIGGLNVNDKPETEDAENSPGEEEEPAYDKTKSFFDTISCEAIERSKGNSNRPDRQHERKLNQETFGVAGFRSYNRRGFGNRGYNRGYGRNNYSRGNHRRNDGNMNRRRSTNNGSASEGAVTKAQTVDA